MSEPNPIIYRLRVRLLAVIGIAKCWRSLYIAEVEKNKELQKQLDWVYRQSLAIAKNIHGEK